MNPQVEAFELADIGDEELRRDHILAFAEEYRKEWLVRIRIRMIRLFYARLQNSDPPFVTADDVRVYFENEFDPPPADDLSRNFLGAVFRARDGWEVSGYTKSRTPGRHANRISKWRRSPDARLADPDRLRYGRGVEHPDRVVFPAEVKT